MPRTRKVEFFTDRKVNKVQIQPLGRQVYIGNRKPTLVFVRTVTDPVGHYHTDKGTCLKFGC